MGGWRSREAVRLSRCGFGKRRRGWDVVLTENAISQIVAVSRQERAPATGPARSTKTSTSTHLEKTFMPAPSQWAGENGSTGSIEIQGPRRQDMAALGSVRRWTTPDAVSEQARDNAWRYSSWCRLSPTLVPFGVPLVIVTAHSQGQECARHWARDIDRIQDINFTWSVFQRGSSTSIYHSVAIIPFSCPSRAHSKSLHLPHPAYAAPAFPKSSTRASVHWVRAGIPLPQHHGLHHWPPKHHDYLLGLVIPSTL